MSLLIRFLLLVACATVTLPALAETRRPLLWKVEAGAGTVYLLGSFHMLKPADYPLPAELEQAYADAERLVFELSPQEMKSPDLPRRLMEAARFTDGRTLRDVLDAETTQKLTAFLGSEAAVAAADPMQPWYLSLNLAVMMIVQSGFDPSLGLDQHLMNRAERDGKPGSGLESAEDQIAALAGAPMDEQVTSLSEALLPMTEMQAKLDLLYRAWRSGDEAAIEAQMLAELVELTPVSAELLNDARNRRWLPQVETLLQHPDDHLVVVGALHLIGDSGLVSLLRESGFEVERVAGAAPAGPVDEEESDMALEGG